MAAIANGSLWSEASEDAAGLATIRLSRTRDGRWCVRRAGQVQDHVFERPEQAEAFIRAHERLPVMVELQIGELYIATRLDAGRGRLFGGTRGRR